MVVDRMGIAVNAALPGAHVMGDRGRRGDLDLDDLIVNRDTGDAFVFGDHLAGQLFLESVIVFFLQIQEALDARQRRDGELRIAFRRTARVGQVQADARQILERAGRLPFGTEVCRFHRIRLEDVVIFDPDLFGRSFEDHHDRAGRHGQAHAVDELHGAFRHFRLRFDHLRIDAVRIGAADDVVTVDHVAALRPHAGHLVILHEDLLDFLAEFDLGAVLLGFLLQLHAHFMREAAAYVGAAAEIVGHQEGVNGEREVVDRFAHIDPVRTEDIHDVLREAPGIDDFLGGIAGGLHEIRMLQQHLDLAHRMRGQEVHRIVHRVAQEHEFVDLVSPAGILCADLVRHRAEAGVQRDVDVLFRFHEAVGFRHAQPVDVHAHFVKEGADFQTVFLRADRHHFMERRLDLEAVAHI